MRVIIFLMLILLYATGYAQSREALFNCAGDYYHRSGQIDIELLEKAIIFGNRALEAAEKESAPDGTGYLKTLFLTAKAYYYYGVYDSAYFRFNKCYNLLQKINSANKPLFSEVILYKAIISVNDKDFDIADSLIKIHTDILQQTAAKHSVEFALAENIKAYLSMAKGNTGIAEKQFHESLKILKNIYGNDHPDIAAVYSNLGLLYRDIDRSKAEHYYTERLKMLRRMYSKGHIDIARTAYNLGNFYKRIGRYSKAGNYFEEAIKICESMGADALKSKEKIYSGYGYHFMTLGNYQKAKEYFQKGLELAEKIELNDLTGCYSNLAYSYYKLGEISKAEALLIKAEEYEKSLGRDHPVIVVVKGYLGKLYIETGRFSKAKPYLEESLQLAEKYYQLKHPMAGRDIENLAIYYDVAGDHEKAEEYFKNSLDYFTAIFGSNHPAIPERHQKIAIHYLRRDMPEKAYDHLEAMMELNHELIYRHFPYLTEDQKLKYRNNLEYSAGLFYYFVSRYHDQNNGLAGRMFDELIKTKGLIVSSHEIALKGARSNPELYENWRDTRELWMNLIQNPRNAARMGIDIDSLENAAEKIEISISKNSPQFNSEIKQSETRWRDIKKSLKEDEAAVEIIRFRKYDFVPSDSVFYAALIIKKDSEFPEISLIENGTLLEEKYLKQYRHLVDEQISGIYDNDNHKRILSELYTEFWSEIDHHLSGKNIIYLSNDGIYHHLNLNTLIDPGSGKNLLDIYDIRLVSGTKDILNEQHRNQDNKSAVLAGSPDFNKSFDDDQFASTSEFTSKPDEVLSNDFRNELRSGIDPLPGSKAEVELIYSKMKKAGWDALLLTGENAAEANLKALRSPSVLHIATHGYFLEDIKSNYPLFPGIREYSENPLLRSMLFLSGAANNIYSDNKGSSDDGILTAYEAQNLDLSGTELVVLSGCNTGSGEIICGEGVCGLQRAFRIAGAESVIMSLWPVNDKVTQRLMVTFYDKWLSGIPKREAFREAQIEIKNNYPEFCHWGGFIMAGGK